MIPLMAQNPKPSTAQLHKRFENARDDRTPIRPQIPKVNRGDLRKVFLEKADSLSSHTNLDYQILMGNVHFRRGGMNMYCDSAHFYEKSGSFEAFGNVKMRQGDTLFIDADQLYYSDSLQLATLYADPGKKVKLRNRKVTLLTDIFNYDLGLDLGYYDVGGQLIDDKNRLTSWEGEYNPTTKEAVFVNDVYLTSLSKNDTLEISTDQLYYNTATHIAELTTQSTIVNGDGVIETTDGVYNTETGQVDLYDRSLVTANNGNTLVGDTLNYNRKTGIGIGYGNIIINDYQNKTILYGDYGYYDEMIDSALVTGRAHAVDYSQGDSIHLHGDTIRAFRVIILVDSTKAAQAQSMANTVEGADADDTSIGIDDKMINDGASAIMRLPDLGDATTRRESLGISDDVLDYGIVSIADLPKIDPQRKLPETNTAPTSKPTRSNGVKLQPDTVRYVVAAPRVRFFKADIQGVCDSMTMVSSDSMLWMNYSPIVWSDNRQVTGDLIQVHFNDSTADWAKVPSNSLMAEKIEDGYFNQLAGKEMIAQFIDGHLNHLDVNGNVEAITFPEENDSTINKVTNLESSFLAADFKNNTISRMKLWSETNATVTPLYLAKKSIFYLRQFRWYETFRPTDPEDIFNFAPELLDLFDEARRAVGAPVPVRSGAAADEETEGEAEETDGGKDDAAPEQTEYQTYLLISTMNTAVTKEDVRAHADDLINFLNDSPCNFWAVATAASRLDEAGFKRLDLRDEWDLEPGGKYYTAKNGSAIFAFIVGTNPAAGYKIISAHSDSPGFRVKPNAEMITDGNILKLNTEVYGGPILYTWFDRPLSLAGRVILRSDDPLHPESRLLKFTRPLLTIPHLAIHFNRAVNEGNKLSRQKDMLPVCAIVNDACEKENFLLNAIARELGVAAEDILDFDVMLYDTTPAMTVGFDNEFITSGRIDDLEMVHCSLTAMIGSSKSDRLQQMTRVMAIFDNEETGSGTKQGAASPVLCGIFNRIEEALDATTSDTERASANSFMISADNAHGVHPNYAEKQDPTNHPVLGGGPVVKINANCKYMTDADSSAVFRSICERAGVPCQYFVNHSDSAGGSTLGNIFTSQYEVRGVDVGAAQWAMHSVRETASTIDAVYMTHAFTEFYNL